MKPLDLNRSVHDLVKEYPELQQIMYDLGFTEINKKAMLNSIGKIMTIPKGAKMKGISMLDVVSTLTSKGFQLVGEMPSTINLDGAGSEDVKPSGAPESKEERTALLKGYLKRLGEGEELESVRADFVEKFNSVDASEIMQAEQELIAEGTPITEIQKLCDLHSALFHGATQEEKIANAGSAVIESMKAKKQEEIKNTLAANSTGPMSTAEEREKLQQDKLQLASSLIAIPGHPLETLTRENDVLAQRISDTRAAIENKASNEEILNKFEGVREIAIHYAEKGDLIYPHLNVQYGISGPSNVMWTVDDEIRDEMTALTKNRAFDDAWFERVSAVLTRAEEMIYKESNILFPICALNFATEEWYRIYHDSKDYADYMGIVANVWPEAEEYEKTMFDKKPEGEAVENATSSSNNDEIVMPGGHVTLEQLTALLNTIPVEITFVDENNINRYFNEGPKLFKRPSMAIDREVFSCHPPKIAPMVRTIIEDFRNGVRDEFPVWAEKQGKTMLIKYMAVRDKNGKYLGTAEFVQEMDFAKEHFQSEDK
ncbi:MAG: DUF438 domain-containing protein [[Eubacterium] sulci]|nr:DUF438 domain-containing protein [[Eubacterium] sulci]